MLIAIQCVFDGMVASLFRGKTGKRWDLWGEEMSVLMLLLFGAGVAGATLSYTLGKIVWKKLMLSVSLGSLSLKMENTLNFLIPWRNIIPMLLGGWFIRRMREKAASLPNVKLEQGTVTTLLEEDGIVKWVSYKTKFGEELKTFVPLTIVRDGCFSNLRRTLCSPKVASAVIFSIIEAEGVWQMFFPATLSSCYRAPHAR